MTRKVKNEATTLLEQHGEKALSIAMRQYDTALELQDIGQQGFWLDVVDEIKALNAGSPSANIGKSDV
ncbi:hypothetical protein AA101099_1273 [Neoasaia chiangmaiensis NBRC 101099]|uniref:Uncharacterized protein n=1 Tax=Neoasaia chiangmaiensis TaxID=320497 RepID=A0A1U9KNI2_9PROT|nr:hypothetical protein [Neoasaia chiangmaiensis]AQS87313.1 hypothetical protein A0U93_04450 [Neoasaia chiangmaiensis]GBR38634.1 hypothetical protein AA101099_1273 [Neoasaia chiangmaiensis NBRC 101099]GEN15809.1 hypothetical protein NCH01_22400 [Neoasaia chiangmaiensis]